MKSTIKFLCIALTIATMLTACSKDNESDSDYIRGKIDDVPFECTTNITANTPKRVPPNDDPTLRITGNWPEHTIKLYISELNASIVTGTYVIEGGKSRSVTITENANTYYAASGCILCFPDVQGSGKIIITEINKKHVRGTFEFVTDATNNPAKKITAGEFYVSRK